ncbi:MAG: S9 family peptidase [Xanthomonadales bacterium]|nr:S9 family peptidase [Xanthomonadales bacterium]
MTRVPKLRPPEAARRPQVTLGGGSDEYGWLRDDDRRDGAVLAHLRRENRYTERWLSRLAEPIRQLETELRGRIPPADQALPIRRGDYDYYWEDRPGRDHPRYWRKPAAGGEAQLLLDAQRRSKGADGYELGALAISPNGRWLAVTEDHQGSGIYTLAIRDLQRRRWLLQRVAGVDADVVWANDDRHLFYVHKDPQSLAALEVRRHRRGSDAETDAVVHREADPSYYVGLYASHSHRHLLIHAEATRSSRLLRIDADRPLLPPVPLPTPGSPEQPQRLRYDDDGQSAWLLSDLDAPDFQLWRCELAALTPAAASPWQLHVARSPAVVLEDFLPLSGDRLVLVERRQAQLGLRLRQSGHPDRLLFEADGLTALTLDDNPEPDPAALRVRRDSWHQPGETLSLNFETGDLQLLKRDALAGPFDPTAYVGKRIWGLADDGVEIPISLLARRDVLASGPAPVWLYGYGAYGDSLDPGFDADRLSLLDRGAVIAMAHVRGGGELGAAWHDAGRTEHKAQSFADFEAVAECLLRLGVAASGQIVAVGGSAGGLLVAASLNRRPDLFAGAVLQVPFVDVLNTMLDASLPLTQLEYGEWGDPRQADARARIASWSPYEQLHAGPYPPLLVTAGLHDGQVSYWEAAKYVARLRQRSPASDPVLLRTDLGTGHQGPSGRYNSVRDSAIELAFALHALGVHLTAAR